MTKILTPGQLMILLQIHIGEKDEIFPSSDWRDRTIEMFRHNEMIQRQINVWTTTERGAAYIDAMCNLPLPECKWVIPK